MATPSLVTGAAGRVGGVGRAVAELLSKQGKSVRAMVRSEDVLTLTGQAPLSVKEFVRKNAATFTASAEEA